MTVRFDWRMAWFSFWVNALFGAWAYRFLDALPLWTSWGVASDTLIGCGLVALLTYTGVSPAVVSQVLRGELPGHVPAAGSALARFAALPSWVRGAAFSLAGLLFAALLVGALAGLAPAGLPYWPFVAFKATSAGTLAGLLTPFVADAARAVAPAFVKAVPRLPVLDVKAALDFYQERLGFRVLFDYDDYAGVARAGFELHLFRVGDPRLPRWTSCRVNVIGVDALYTELQRAGVIHPHGALANQPWGFREFTILDLCGNAIVFGERLG